MPIGLAAGAPDRSATPLPTSPDGEATLSLQGRGDAPRSLIAALPVLAALLSVALVSATGLTRRSLEGTAFEDFAYGFFLDRYAIFLFAAVYGLARLLAVAILEPGRRRGWRALTLPLAAGLFLAACFHPTFGGLVLRSGYFAGAGSFLRATPIEAVAVIGPATGALVFALALGLGVALVRLRPRLTRRAIATGILAYAALALGACLLVLPRFLGIDLLGGWPHRPMGAATALQAAALVGLAALPHALLVALRRPGG